MPEVGFEQPPDPRNVDEVLALAIAFPAWRVMALEATGKKARFQQEAVAALGLANVSILTGRAEEFAPSLQDDVAILPSFLVVPVFALSIWATSPKRASRLSKHRRDHGTFRRWLADWVAAAAKARSLLSSPREHGLGVLGMTLYWAGDIVCLWAALTLVGGAEQLTLSALILAYSGGYVLSRRSLPAGGAGVVEVALTYALVGMGVPFAPALVAVLIYRLFNFWLPIVPALALMPTIRELRQRFHRVEQAS